MNVNINELCKIAKKIFLKICVPHGKTIYQSVISRAIGGGGSCTFIGDSALAPGFFVTIHPSFHSSPCAGDIR
jgi:hypothetical protein